jgi:hypothetical protein
MQRGLPSAATWHMATEYAKGVWRERTGQKAKEGSTCGPAHSVMLAQAPGSWLRPCPEQGGDTPLLVS